MIADLLSAVQAGAKYMDALRGWQDNGASGQTVTSDDLDTLMADWHEKTHAVLSAPKQSTPLTHAELVDAFPCIRGHRNGFEAERITNVQEFGLSAAAKGKSNASQEHACACIVMTFAKFGGISFGHCIDALDAEHKAALVGLVAAVCERGVA